MRSCSKFLLPVAVVTAAVVISIPPSSAAVTASYAKTPARAGVSPRLVGRAVPLPRTPQHPKNLATTGRGSSSPLGAADAALVAVPAARRARASGKPVTVSALTTETTTATVGADDQPDLSRLPGPCAPWPYLGSGLQDGEMQTPTDR